MESPLPTVPAPGPAGPQAPTDWSSVSAPGGGPRSGFGVGVLLSRTFRTWWRDLPAFALFGVVASLPMAWGVYHLYGDLAELLVPDPSSPFANVARIYAQVGGLWFASFVLATIQVGAVVHGASRRLRGAKAGLGEMISVGLARSFAMFGMLFVALVATVGTACLVVPPFLLATGWAAAAPAVAVEGAGPIRALGRSWHLTRGHRWKIFGGVLLVYLAMFLVTSVLQGALTGASFSWPGAAASMTADDFRAMALPMGILQLAGGIVGSPLLVATAVVHHGLCLVKEGGDPVQLAEVFE